jgi:hypothetical protein
MPSGGLGCPACRRQESVVGRSRADSAEVLGASIGHKGVSLSIATDHCTSGLGKFKIIGYAKNQRGEVADHVLP